MDSAYSVGEIVLRMGEWRQTFWKRSIAALLRDIGEASPIFQRDFWTEQFPRIWLANQGVSMPPPLAPSLRLPQGGTPYATSAIYINWVNTSFHSAISAISPYLGKSICGNNYDAADTVSRLTHAAALSAATAIIITEKLGLVEDTAQPKRLLERLCDQAELRFRHRNARLWPTESKRPYVDVTVAPIYGQVLVYECGQWNEHHVTRSLALKEGGATGNGLNLVHTRITRTDIELAVWCEIMSRLAPFPREIGSPHDNSHQEAIPAEMFPQLLPHQVPWARAILDATRNLATEQRESTRFALPESMPREMVLRHLDRPEWRLNHGIALLPPYLTTPVLEDEQLKCNLDWEWIAPAGEWMDIRLIALENDRAPPELIDAVPANAEDDDPLLALQLGGDSWERIKRNHSPMAILSAIGRIWFGYRTSHLGTGAFVLGVLDLRKK